MIRGFGAFPTQNRLKQLIGWPNLLKRCQAADIIDQLALEENIRILDLGCGGGHFSLEFARQNTNVIGLDINSLNLKRLSQSGQMLDLSLAGCLADGRYLPFQEQAFDRIFVSELLGYVTDLDQFFTTIHRYLKPGGILVISNGLGHPAIETLYQRFPTFFKHWGGKRIPTSYNEYTEKLNHSFGNTRTQFLSEVEIIDAVQRAGLTTVQVKHHPGHLVSSMISYMMFAAHLMGLKTYGPLFFSAYPILQSLDKLDRNRNGLGLLLQAKR